MFTKWSRYSKMKKNLVIIGKGKHSMVVLELIKEKEDLELILHFDGKDFKKLNDIYKKIAILEKKVEFLESKIKLKNSSDSREEKWNEFQSIIRLQEKNNSRKVLN